MKKIMTEPIQIVVDTNVVYSGLRSNRGASYQLLTKLNDKRWKVNISTTFIFECEERLKNDCQDLGLTIDDVDDFLDGLCSIANKQTIFYLWRPVSRDPDDDFLIDLAVESAADYIITYNEKDLKIAEKFGIMVITPKEFLQKMGEIK